jgi:hypothetical protein
MTIRPELLDELLKDYQNPQDLLGENGIIQQLTKAMIERCLQVEMEEHLGYPKHGRKGEDQSNVRNGKTRKTLKSEHGGLEITMPRDRDASFEPTLVKKRQTQLEGFEEKILALYARGMTTRDIQAQLQELYGVEVSLTFISNVTEEVMDEVRHWQNRPLEPLYPILYVDWMPRQSAREPASNQQGRVPGIGGDNGGAEGVAGHVDVGERRRQVLALGLHGAPQSGHKRLFHCLRGRSHRVAGGH